MQKTYPAGQTCRLRFTLLAPQPFARLSEIFLGYCRQPQDLHINGVLVELQEVVMLPGTGEPWAGFTAYDQLWTGAKNDRKITLLFETPTTFRQGDINIPLPLPRLVFHSLVAKWQYFCPEYPLHPAITTFIDQGVFPAKFRVESKILDYGKQRKYLGFTGSCTFGIQTGKQAAENDGWALETLVHQCNVLADFAFYAGAGQKTTMGMGQCRRILK